MKRRTNVSITSKRCLKENLYSWKGTILSEHPVLLFKDYKTSLSLSVPFCLYLSIAFKALVVTALQGLLLWWCIYCFCVIIRFFPLLLPFGEGFFKPVVFLLAQYWCFFKSGVIYSRSKGFFPQDWCIWKVFWRLVLN